MSALTELMVIYLQAGRCAYATLIMAAYWCTEALPIAVTALLPFALMPWLGIISAKDIAKNYLKVFSLSMIINTRKIISKYTSEKNMLSLLSLNLKLHMVLVHRTRISCSLVDYWWQLLLRDGIFIKELP